MSRPDPERKIILEYNKQTDVGDSITEQVPSIRLRLTPEHRQQVCFHEAAHAVIYAYGGYKVRSLSVAPIGSDENSTIRNRHGDDCLSIGLCETKTPPFFFCVHWNSDKGSYEVDVDQVSQIIAQTPHECIPEIWREIRTYICGTMAGPIADEIFLGVANGQVRVNTESEYTGQPDDISKALGFCRLLPKDDFKYDHLLVETERILRLPEITAMVFKLAAELEAKGTVDDICSFLPEPLPNWPQAFMLRKPCVHPGARAARNKAQRKSRRKVQSKTSEKRTSKIP